MPVTAILGPRQSGKTTLAKTLFENYTYYNLELPDVRAFAKEDPRSLLSVTTGGIILDEIQHAPELLSYIQGLVDESGKMGKYIITGSQNFLLMEAISQSLAGRVAVFNLLPFSMDEMRTSAFAAKNPDLQIYKGFYPPIYTRKLKNQDWLPSYIKTYIERDVRKIINIQDLHKFHLFLKLCAGRIGQLINYESFSNEIGVDGKTLKRWMGILEASYIIFLLQPHHINYNKRLVKTPKLYFYDTGLACNLLGLQSADDVSIHFMKGSLFENLIIAELLKYVANNSQPYNIYFWRDNTGNEIDCLLEKNSKLFPIEIKAGKTLNTDYFKGLNFYAKTSGLDPKQSFLIYGGNEIQNRNTGHVLPWNNLDLLFKKIK